MDLNGFTINVLDYSFYDTIIHAIVFILVHLFCYHKIIQQQKANKKRTEKQQCFLRDPWRSEGDKKGRMASFLERGFLFHS